MADANPTESPLEAAAGAAGPHVTTAFELLSNDIRLSILLALWEAYDPRSPNDAVVFSELYDRVGVRDSGQFTYHLDKLTPHFVEKADDGYELRDAGLAVVRAIIAGVGIEKPTVPASELDLACNRCGDGRVHIDYRDGAAYLTCPECAGFMTAEEYPRGTLVRFEFDPAGLARRRPPELLAACAIQTENRTRMMRQGVCPACSGPIDASLQICEQHTSGSGEVCPNCGTPDSARVRYICTVCKNRNRRPVELTVIDHPAVIGFFADRDMDLRWDIGDPEEAIHLLAHLWEMEHTLVSTDPVIIRVTIPCDGDELQLTLDEERDVIDVHEGD